LLGHSGEKVVEQGMGSRSRAARMMWPEICSSDQYRGRWVALDNVRYDPTTSQPIEAEVVDADEDLADLCGRMRASSRTSCAILHCEEAAFAPVSRRRSSAPHRAAQH
jgi:hypothetical protein